MIFYISKTASITASYKLYWCKLDGIKTNRVKSSSHPLWYMHVICLLWCARKSGAVRSKERYKAVFTQISPNRWENNFLTGVYTNLIRNISYTRKCKVSCYIYSVFPNSTLHGICRENNVFNAFNYQFYTKE